MFSFIKNIFSPFWGEPETDLSLEEAYSVLSSPEVEEIEPVKEPQRTSFEDYSCYHKTGAITSAENGSYTIDNKYSFNSTLENLTVGMEISFTLYVSDNEVKVADVAIRDTWHSESSQKSSWCKRSLVCKVDRRKGREITVTPGNFKFDLNSISSEFIPIVGDWIELEAKVEVDENVTDLFGKVLEMETIRPMRPRIVGGCIKEWNVHTREGAIDRVVYFNSDALSCGYMPVIGDRVVCEVIESDQGRYTCRALKILPQKLADADRETFEPVSFESERDDIVISDDLSIQAKTLGEKQKLLIEIQNNTAGTLILNAVELPSKISQCEVTTKISKTEILAGKRFLLEVLCTVKNVGSSRELLVFSFENYKARRWITVHLRMDDRNQRAKYVDRGSILLSKGHFKNRHDELVRGRRISAAPRFISARLPEYPVPEKLLNIFNSYESGRSVHFLEELKSSKPCLDLPLSFNTYEDRFHTLLHLEEIYFLEEIKKYSQQQAVFIRNGEYLMLEIENLSEKRPSLIIGDKIIAKDSYDEDAVEYEGFIHRLGAKHVYLKFSQAFHDQFNGEDVAVMAVASRTPFRRMHQAVGLAIRNLGRTFLFPTKVVSQQQPQTFLPKHDVEEAKDENESESRAENESESRDENTKALSRSGRLIQALNKMKEKSLKKMEENPIDAEMEETEKYKSRLLLTETEAKPTCQQPHKFRWLNQMLNYYQKEAVKNILYGEARPLPYFIFGPPGTGKTVTLVETILQLLRLIPHSRLLVATPSNSAADLIATRLIETGLLKPGDLVRLVGHRVVSENLLPVKLVPYCATADVAREGTKRNGFTVTDSGLTLGCNSAVIGRHRITVGTCMTLGTLYQMGFPKGHFTHVIVDEAGQITEPEILIPFSLMDTSTCQIILAGDPMQLGPVVTSKAALEYGLEETFFVRLINRFPYARDSKGFPETGGYDPRLVTRLVHNYRSLPNALVLCSNLFYDGELIPTISPDDSKEARLLESLREILPSDEDFHPPSVVFHGVSGENYQTADCPSWFNPNEASQVFYYVNELYRLGLKSTDIGIISPYVKQVKQIRALLAEAEFEVPKVGTVEEFQGQEFNVIIISTVRSGENMRNYDLKYHLGFVSQPRRVNVALSRAQALMIVIGNPHLLQSDPYWRSVIKHCVDIGSYCGCDL